tara:strand:- start:4954 stop:6471 length:1518 start_codon:yes stop_codon:yes gene_type:complete
MAQPLQSINLVAPGFKGVNTEDSPIAQDPSFADVADNAVIDKRGRIAARKGIDVLTTTKTVLGTDYIHKIHHFYDDAGNEVIFSTGNNKIMTGTTTLVDATPGSYTISANDWKIVNFNDKAYFFQRGYDPLVYDNANGLRTFTVANSTATDATLKCHEALSAFGRLWVVDNATDTQTIYWSDLLIGNDFTGGSSGSINVTKAWPDGYDEVVALAAHNNNLVIFGQHSILLYEGASSPASMTLADTVSGVGCIDRNTVQSIGTDILFMSNSGLRSLGRAIQEKALPITDLSVNVKTEIIEVIDAETEPMASVYSPENSFYLICFPSQATIYCFDLKGRLENNSYRTTRWTSVGHKSFERDTDGTLYIGTTDGIGKYGTFLDNASVYRFRYFSPALTFGDPSKTKIVKKIKPTLIGANEETIFVKWAYDFETTFTNYEISVGNQVPAYYGVSEYTVGTFTGGILTTKPTVNATGSGGVVTIGLEADIDGAQLSIQEINVLALIGKTV